MKITTLLTIKEVLEAESLQLLEESRDKSKDSTSAYWIAEKQARVNAALEDFLHHDFH